MKAVFLLIQSWIGVPSLDGTRRGEHYYGHLYRYSTKTRVDIDYVLSESDARKLNKAQDEDAPPYKPGEDSQRFLDRSYLVERAKLLFSQRFPDCEILIEGDPIDLDPRTVLVGPTDFVEQGNELVTRAEANDWWEGDEKKMKVIYKEWRKLWDDYGVER